MARSCSHSSLLENLATMTWSACVSPSGSAYFKFTDVRIAVFPGNVPRITCTANLAQVRFLPGFKQACLVKAAGPGDDELSATGSCFALLQLTTIDIRTKTVRSRFIWYMIIPVIRIKKTPAYLHGKQRAPAETCRSTSQSSQIIYPAKSCRICRLPGDTAHTSVSCPH